MIHMQFIKVNKKSKTKMLTEYAFGWRLLTWVIKG